MNQFKNDVVTFLQSKRLYGNKYKIFRVVDYSNSTEEEVFLLTKLTFEKLEMVLMFIEGLFKEKLDLSKLTFYATLLFDVYEVENGEEKITIQNWSENALINLDIPSIRIYSASLDSIRSRYSGFQDMIIESELLRKNIEIGERAERVIHYHKDRFNIEILKKQDIKGKKYIETLYEHFKVVNGELLNVEVWVLQEISIETFHLYIDANVFLENLSDIVYRVDLDYIDEPIDFNNKWIWIASK